VAQRSHEGAQAHLNLHAAFHVQFSTLERFKSTVLAASSPHEIEMARSAYHAASEAILDRTIEQLDVQMLEDGIDPVTRKPIRR
jgi:hypothetical protein